MPVPTPPKANLLAIKPVEAGPSKSTRKLSNQIKSLTENLEKNSVDIPEEKPTPSRGPQKKVFRPTKHMTQSPFRDNEDMRKLHDELKKKEQDPKKPVKRSPRRKPTARKNTGEK